MPTICTFASEVERCRTPRDLGTVTRAFLSRRGVMMMSYHHLPPIGAPDHMPSVTVSAVGFPDDWVERYVNEQLAKVDPIHRHAQEMMRPFWWSEIGQLYPIDQDERDYMIKLRRQRLGDGLAIPVFGPRGRNGYVGLGFGQVFHVPQAWQIVHLQMAVQIAHISYRNMVLQTLGDKPRLSSRERDVLRLLADGKTIGVIAQILGISSGTVDTYARRVYAKLDTNDRVTAALRAICYGLLD